MSRTWGALLVGFLVAAGVLGVVSRAEGVSSVEVCGKGYGHGVGLSQWGAYGRANAGQNHAQILQAYYQGVSLQRYPDNPSVRVLVGERALSGSHDVVVRSGDRFRNLATGGAVSLGSGTYRVEYLSDRRLYRVTNVSTGSPVGSYTGPIVFEPASGANLSYGGKGYRGTLGTWASGSSLLLVNTLPMEDYIRGVVPNEMPASWAAEALKSQAVAARSYARATPRGAVFDFYADTRDQVYGGASSETISTNSAVAATDRVVAVFGGEPITAFFHSSSGGYTEDSAYVFGAAEYLEAVRDVDAASKRYEARVGSPWTRWSGPLDPNGSPELGIGSITAVRVTGRSPSGRATSVEVTGTQGQKTISGQYGIRQGLESTGLRRADGSSFAAGDLPSARVSFGSSCN